jgi:2-hydroxy-3-keto-5-methylthiopentenyl-1-phosphate phosphatase
MEKIKTLVQSDFDGTITEKDISFMILEEFADGDWKSLLEDYRQGRISVGKFNKDTFGMVKENRQKLVAYSRENGKIREGFKQLVEYCRSRGFRFVITSNGLDFYVEALLKEIGLGDVEFHAALTNFSNNSLRASYIGPSGEELLKGFKQAYTASYIKEGYRVIYLGNGPSDVGSAKLSYRAFATDSMIKKCKEQGVNYTPFNELKDITEELKRID